MKSILQVDKVSKSFSNNNILKDISFTIEKGECYCLVGKNGSGKSTLINIIIDFLNPDGGEISFLNESFFQNREMAGVLPEMNPLLEEFRLIDFLEYVGTIYKVPKGKLHQRINFLIDLFFDDQEVEGKLLKEFSKGMRLKAGIVAAVLHEPTLLILDEPFDGLDLASCNILVSFLDEFIRSGNSVLLASHNIVYCEKIATHVLMLREGYVEIVEKEEILKEQNDFINYLSNKMV
ncbi:MAG: ABC transporter ATP-binding protein [Balneolaceae bacterium]|nr:ABC transporter ATP-binding protein [Balneolaceae bacterium]